MTAIEPIGPRQRREVLEETERYIALAEELLERRFARIPVRFDLRGQAAGMFRAAPDGLCIRYNPWLFARHYIDNLRDTVPHEVAHYIVHQTCRRRVRPHGPQWQALMEAFGANPEVRHSQDLTGVPSRRQQRHSYQCECREHAVSSTRHNRVQRGEAEYRCRYCSGTLRYTGGSVID